MKYYLLFPMALFAIAASSLVYFSSVNLPYAKSEFCIQATMNPVEVCPHKPSFTKLTEISEHAKNAIMLSEDASFFDHRGFDWYELRASVEQNLRSSDYVRGGSTITQQLAKNLFLSPEKSMIRKIKEAFYTIHLERAFSKTQIFELYLNVIEFGPQVYGIRAAARHYFQKSPAELNILESSFLAFLLPSPRAYSKSFRYSKLSAFAKERVLDIAYRMYRFKRISEAQYHTARELVDLFPWTDLGPESRSLLGEKGVQFDSPLPELSEEEPTLDAIEEPAESFDDGSAEFSEGEADETIEPGASEPQSL